jgi:hypothetical protein
MSSPLRMVDCKKKNYTGSFQNRSGSIPPCSKTTTCTQEYIKVINKVTESLFGRRRKPCIKA